MASKYTHFWQGISSLTSLDNLGFSRCTVAFVLLLASVSSSISNQSAPSHYETNICTGHPSNRLLPDFGDCSAYYHCQEDGLPMHGKCAGTQRWSPKRYACVPPEMMTDCFQCPRDQVFVDLPVDFECLQFVRCFANLAEQHTCSEGLLFDPVKKQCNFRHLVRCGCPSQDDLKNPYYIRQSKTCDK